MEAAEYQPLTGNALTTANYQEYFLQGSILEAECSKLLDRLQGLCDNVPREQFTDHERTFVIKNPNSSAVMVKACKAFQKADVPWQIRGWLYGSRAMGSRPLL
ncbi:mediator of RNA polymerase II transcription subunit 18-like [Styela clava]